MSASQNTINLQNEITAIDTKITALNNASSKIDGVKVKVKTTKDDMSSLHIAGQKYDEEYEDEQNGIKVCKKKITSKKSSVKEIIDEQIGVLQTYRMIVSAELLASKAADKLREEYEKLKGGK